MGEHPAGQLHSTREICEKFQLPFDTVAKVMQVLNHHGLLTSTQGIKGGYVLSMELKNINFLNLFQIIEGKIPDHFCDSGKKGPCQLTESCNIISAVDRLNRKVRDSLFLVSLEDLLFENKKKVSF
jgi:Rrf2 family protein